MTLRPPFRILAAALLCVSAVLGSGCGEDSTTPTPNPATCQVSPASLAFGDVVVGQTETETFTITNTGGQTLTGTVSVALCGVFSLVGDASFSLAANESKVFTVSYSPTDVGADGCDISLGTNCDSLPVSGTGIPVPPLVQWRLDGNGDDANGGDWDAGISGGLEFADCAYEGSGSLWFDGASYANFVIDGSVNLFETGNEFTIMAWIKPDRPSKASINTIMANATAGLEEDGFKLFFNHIDTADGALIFETGNGATGNAVESLPGVVVPGTWQHVAVTVNRTAGTATLYHMGFALDTTGGMQADFRTAANAYVGAFAGPFFHYRGFLDDFRFYDTELSAAEVLAVVDEAVSGTDAECFNPVVEWTFDNTEEDLFGGPWNVGPVQGTDFQACSYQGSASLFFDGDNDYADFEIDGNATQFGVGNRFTIMAWIRPNNPFEFSINTIMANAPDQVFRDGFKFYFNSFNSVDGALVFETGNGSEGAALVSNPGVIQPGVWQHVAVSVDRAAGSATMYRNGLPLAATGSVRTDFKMLSNTFLGAFSNNVFNYLGNLDEFRFFAEVLTEKQIARIAEQGFTGTSAECAN